MKICIDLDGVIASIKETSESYKNVQPIPGAIEKVQELKKAGHYIIIYTARHMKTCEGNTGKVLARVGQLTLDWLENYDIPYDEIHFGKPYADIYIDDNAFRFTEWKEISGDGSNLPVSNEKKLR